MDQELGGLVNGSGEQAYMQKWDQSVCKSRMQKWASSAIFEFYDIFLYKHEHVIHGVSDTDRRHFFSLKNTLAR